MKPSARRTQEQVMTQQFKIVDDGDREYGPVDLQTLRGWYGEGRIATTDRIYSVDEDRWGSLEEFVDVAAWEYTEDLGTFLGGRVRVVVGDLTNQRVDAVVNAAKASLLLAAAGN
jgi:hypothetical protein